MIEYRKHKSGREFARIEGDTVLRVLNKARKYQVTKTEDPIIALYIKVDEFFFPSTESEFKEQLTIALERINNEKI